MNRERIQNTIMPEHCNTEDSCPGLTFCRRGADCVSARFTALVRLHDLKLVTLTNITGPEPLKLSPQFLLDAYSLLDDVVLELEDENQKMQGISDAIAGAR